MSDVLEKTLEKQLLDEGYSKWMAKLWRLPSESCAALVRAVRPIEHDDALGNQACRITSVIIDRTIFTPTQQKVGVETEVILDTDTGRVRAIYHPNSPEWVLCQPWPDAE